MKEMESREYFLKEIHKQIRNEIRENVKYRIEKPESRYLAMCQEMVCATSRGWKPRLGRLIGKNKDENATRALWADIEQEVAAMISEEIRLAKANRMKIEINAVTSKAMISCGMKAAGLEFQFTPQQYRAKVAVKIAPKGKVVFYISYNKTQELLPTIIESAQELKESFGKISRIATIQKASITECWE